MRASFADPTFESEEIAPLTINCTTRLARKILRCTFRFRTVQGPVVEM